MPTVDIANSVANLFKGVAIDFVFLLALMACVYYARYHWCVNYSEEYHRKADAKSEAKDAMFLTFVVGMIATGAHFAWRMGLFG